MGTPIHRLVASCALVLLASAGPVRAQGALDTADVLKELAFTPSEIQTVKDGGIIHRSLDASNPRELVAAMAFVVPGKPAELVTRAKDGLLNKIDENTMQWGIIQGPATEATFAKLTLAPDPAKRARRYTKASPGEDLNLSREEIATFAKLGRDATPAAVETALRRALAARVEAYRAKGLAGIAPYARSKDEVRSVAADLESATKTLKSLERRVPKVVKYLLDYPSDRPPDAEERLGWSQIKAHGVPTIILSQGLYVPEGEAWVLMQRQYYVSEGYNCEQAIAVFLPVQLGTGVIYVNRTSTDQVEGFGGGAKRSIGSHLLASQLEALFQQVQKGKGS